jgi:DNA-binding CsgD family transcriptional regulator
MEAAWPLTGRDDELELLRARLTSPGASVVIAGAAGVGKSRLASEATAIADGLGVATRRVAATKAAATIPFGAFAALLPDESSSETRAALLRRTVAAIAALGAGKSLLLWVDDAHELDDASAALVHHLATAAAVSLVVTVRSGEPTPDSITALWKDGIAVRIELQALSRTETEQLVRTALAGDADDVLLDKLWNASFGNPLYLRELITGAMESGTLTREAGLWRLGATLHAPKRLAELLQVRLSSVAADDLPVLQLLAFAQDVGLATLEATYGIEPIERLEQAGLIRVEPDDKRRPVRLVHPLYAEVLRDRLASVRERAIKRQLGDLIEAAGARRRGDVLRMVLLRLDTEGAVTAELLMRAANDAYFTYDFSVAERVARSAIEAGADWETHRLLAEILRYAGRCEETEVILAAFEPASLPDDAARSLVAMARSENLFRGLLRASDAQRVLDEARKHISDPMWLDEMAALAASFDLMAGDVRQAIAVVSRIIERPRDRAMVAASVTASMAYAVNGRTVEAIEIAQRGLDAGLVVGPQPLLSDPATHIVMRCHAMVLSGLFDEAQAQAGPIYDWVVGQGIAIGQAWLGLILGAAVLGSGRPRRAEHLFREAAIASVLVNDASLESWAWAETAHACALRRDVAGANEALRHIEVAPPMPMDLTHVEIERARAWTATASGENARAREILMAAGEHARLRAQYALEAWALHDVARMGDGAAVAGRLAELNERVQGAAQPLRAEHAAASVAQDAVRLEAVSGAFDELGHVLVAAEAAAEAARAYRRAGRPRQAAAAAARANALAARCEGARTLALEGAEDAVPLTRREHEIASLAAQGLPSKAIAQRLVVSVRTVENHLQRVYEKLGVGGRADLADRLSSHEN